MNFSAIYYAQRDGVLILKLVGAIRIASHEANRLSAGLEAFIRGLAERTDSDQLLVDLTEAVVVDSTYLGLLAQAAQFCLTHWNRRPILISTRPDINTVLESVCFDQVFRVFREPLLSAEELQLLAPEDMSDAHLARMMLDAHRALARITPENEKQFRNVIDLLNAELKP